MISVPGENPETSHPCQAMSTAAPVEVFATCPSSAMSTPGNYLQHVAEVARWSEEQGCKGILVYSDNSIVDPWLVSQVIIENTEALCPLVAVQPVYMHPYTVAKMVTTYALLYGRKIYLNMIAGGFKNDLLALNDVTPHDNRYDRLREYTQIIKDLLEGQNPVSFQGQYYTTDKLKLLPPLDQTLFPGIFMSGSSEAGIAAAKATGATAIQYPKPVHEYTTATPVETPAPGIRIGIISRESEEQAWSVAHERFPENRKGQLTYQLAMKVTDSVWHKQLSNLPHTRENSPYWLFPLHTYKTSCPYLVGSYARIGEQLSRYIASGYRTLILDVPPDNAELVHTRRALDHVRSTTQ